MLGQACIDLADFIERGEFLPLVAIVGGLTFGIVAVVACNTKTLLIARAKERTRRELAAYVAEGSLSPEQAVAMMEAGSDPPAQA